MKYTLDEIKEMLLEPSFDMEAHGLNVDSETVERLFDIFKEAIAHYEKLNKSNNGEGF